MSDTEHTPVADTAGIDAAWREAQDARPSDVWSVSVRCRSSGRWEAWAQDLASNERPPVIRIGEGNSEAAALLALAAALRTPKPEGEPE